MKISSYSFDNTARCSVRVNTFTRDAAIKICCIIADALDSEKINNSEVRIYIDGDAGKSLVVDAITRHIADGQSAYKMPADYFVEGGALNALRGNKKRHLIKAITHKGQKCAASFRHLEGPHEKSLLESLRCHFDKSRVKGLKFFTEPYLEYKNKFKPDISIILSKDSSASEANWQRSWKISIENKEFMTPRLLQAFANLEAYNKRQRARRSLQKPACPA